MFEEIRKVENPYYLVITPLKVGDEISDDIHRSILDTNKIPFDWVSFKGDNNIPTNTSLALEEYEKRYEKVKHLIKIDNDLKMDDGLLDCMHSHLLSRSFGSDVQYGYVYCPFSYVLSDGRRISFNQEFDIMKLIKSNFISSNSMINRDALDVIGGFITDPQYERLLDWALWLKFYREGFIGKLLKEKGFEATMKEDGVSARSNYDYQIKSTRVMRDFVNPIIRDMIRKGVM